MKIGVVTFHRAINYGAVLQTYALQIALNNMGVDNEVIDYRCKEIEEKYWKKNKVKFNKTMLKSLLLNPRNRVKREKFTSFINKNVKMSKEVIYDYEDLNKLNNKYNQFITGSDQVWHYYLTNFDKAYFLGFVDEDNKRNSYAASFGMHSLPSEYINQYKKLLAGFNNIAVREEYGKKIVKKLLDRDVETVLDPTFLLNIEGWSKIAEIPDETDYILIYIMKGSETLFKFAKDLSEKTGCKIKYITNGVKKPIKGDYIKTAGIEEFVGLFKNARYVITNSFHGTAFSLIMNKDFFIELQAPPAANDRLENIMDKYNLRGREIINGKNSNMLNKINYNEVNRLLNIEREKSIKYLSKIITPISGK